MPETTQDKYLKELREGGWYVRSAHVMNVGGEDHLIVRMERDVTTEVEAEKAAAAKAAEEAAKAAEKSE